MNYNYTLARPIGSNEDFERIIDTDYPVNDNGLPIGEDDMFKLEYSGWTRYVEFAPMPDKSKTRKQGK